MIYELFFGPFSWLYWTEQPKSDRKQDETERKGPQPQVGVKLLAAAVRTWPVDMGRTPYQMNYRVPHAALLFSEVEDIFCPTVKLEIEMH